MRLETARDRWQRGEVFDPAVKKAPRAADAVHHDFRRPIERLYTSEDDWGALTTRAI